ncbi:MAG: DMT family transporter [Pseudomonadota bacterium]
MKTVLYTALALLAFAGNSVLCRHALSDGSIDAASFTVARMLSGIVVLALLLMMTRSASAKKAKGSWKAAGFLFLYAAAFSYAFLSLDTGTGALILFGTVQITMILTGLAQGNKLLGLEWFGVLVAFSGFVYLVLPHLTTPSIKGFILMAIAGISWAFYTLNGMKSENPLSDTSYNFLRTLPLVLILLALTVQTADLSSKGLVLAVVSGGVTSGIGYAIWYRALPGLSTLQAGILQLLVPVIAAAGGVAFTNEVISLHLLTSSLLIIGGILAVILSRTKTVTTQTDG